MSTPSAKLNPVTLCLPLGLLPLFLLAGCAGTEVVPVSLLTTLNLQGVVQGGQQPVTDSKLQLYATGTTGDGSTSTALLSQPFQTGSNGEFTISGAYTCPSTASLVYLIATGGNPGLSSGSSNSSIALMAPLGPCGNLSNVPFTTVNEVTTVGSIWPLAPYGKSVAQIGSGNSDAQAFDAAAASINQLISVANGTAPGPMLPAGDVAPTDKLYTLASIIAACVNSSGGSAGDGSPCGQLFSNATSGGVPAPSDTIAAALAIAQNPNRNVVDIFDLSPMNGAFQPILSSPPADWTLPILAIPAAPTISPDTGTLASGQTVSIAEDTSGAAVYYTMDGSSPSEASQPYSGPIALTDSGTVSAIAIKASLRSSIASKIFKVVVPVSVALIPGSATLAPAQSQMFTATVANSSNAAVTWSLSSAMGSISAGGLYTAPASITAAQTVTVTATSVADSTKTASAAVSLAPPVSIGLTPGSVTLTPSQTQAFTASVANSSNTVVTWSLSPAVGSISAAGLYSAPASITSTQAVTVTATSVANPTKSASSSVSLVPPVSVALTPGSVTLTPSQTQAFTAAVANSSNTAVTWSLSPAVGSISAAGIYTAPASITSGQTVTVTATSVADSTKTASAAVSLAPPVSIGLTPGSVTLTPSQTQAFTASVANSSNTAVTWSLSPAVGSISAAGFYTAPASIPASQTVTVTATSVANSTKIASASVSLAPSVSVALTPGSVTLTPSQTQAFTASVSGTSNTAVTWSLSLAVGSISAGGVYTAPASIASAQTITVTATSVANSTKSASASVSLAPPVSVALTPGSVTLAPAQTQMFTATVSGASNTSITWSVSPAVGSISGAGLYTAPISITSAQRVTVTATSASDPTKSASASVSLTPPVNVALSPGSVGLTPSQTQVFTASVASSSNTSVTWSLSPTVGSISATGFYTAPASIAGPQTVTVTATSVADPTKSASSSVSLAPPASVALTPGSVTLTPSQTQAFTGTVTNASNTTVTWSLSPVVGTISAGGLYTAPASITAAQTVTVTATSVADSTKTASAAVSLAPPVSIGLTPGSVTLTPSQTQAFTASVANSSNTVVTWSLSPAVGSISAGGLYTAPASISSAQTVTVTATSVADSTKSASASVSLAPPVSVALTPGSVTLTPSQTQAFTATVANTSNTAVTWSLSPAMGSISAGGLYTAPASIPSAQTVRVTATSVADSTKSASSSVSLGVPTLSINASSVAFGNVVLNTAATQSVTLTSTGTAPVTISSATLTGTGFTVSGATFPVTLNPGQEATLNIEFDPTVVGAATGQLSISSNSSTNGASAIGLSGTGTEAPAGPTTYYVDNCLAVGKDSNSGTSPSAAWLTIAHVNAQTFNPGDSVLFQRTCTWRAVTYNGLFIPSSGSSGNPITFGAYGTGPNPIFDGTMPVTSWTNYSGNIWSASVSSWPAVPDVVLFNGVWGMPVAGISSLESPLQWYLAGKTLHVYSVGPPTNIGASYEGDLIETNGKSYINITGLTLKGGLYYDLLLNGGTGINVYGNILYGSNYCLVLGGSSPTTSGNAVYSNVVSYCNADGIEGSGGNQVGNRIYSNDVSYTGLVTDNATAIGLWQGADYSVYNNQIYSNYIHDNNSSGPIGTTGITLDTLGAPGPNYIYWNKLWNNNGGGVVIYNTAGAYVHYNISWGSNGTEWEFQAGSGGSDLGSSYFYNNTAYAYNSDGCFQNAVSASNVWKNNICIVSGPGHVGFSTVGTGATTQVADYNLIYATGSATPYNWNGTIYASSAALYTATSQGQHDKATNPQVASLVNTSAADFSLQSTSPAIGAGVDLGSSFQLGLLPSSTWPTSVLSSTQLPTWNIGTYLKSQQLQGK